MKLEDESLLSAYLDGELDLPRRLVVEAALQSKPQLVEQLQELAAVRGLIDGMPRPTVSFDVSTPVLEGIRARPWIRIRRVVRHQLTQPRTVGLGLGTALAASLLLAVGLRIRHPAERPPAKRDVAAISPVLAAHPAASGLPRPLAKPHRHRAESAVAIAAAPVEPPALRQLSDGERRAVVDRDRIRRLLDRSDVRRITLVLDQIGNDALAKVDTAIEQTRRYDSTRATFRISQGIVVDPAHPNEAVVYLVVLNDQEPGVLRGNLTAQFPDAKLDDRPATPPPAVIAQLGDAGQLEMRSGSGVPPLTTPPADITETIAQRHAREPGITTVEPVPDSPLKPKRGVRPAVKGESIAVAHDERPAVDDPGELDGREPSGPIVYLVWITTPAPG
jgi:hypothetical protein